MANLYYRGPGDAFRTGRLQARLHEAFLDREYMRGIRLGHKAFAVEHQGIVGSGRIGLYFCQNRLQQIAMMNLRIKAIGRKAAYATGDQRDAAEIVNRVLEFRQHDERGTSRIKPGVHARGVFHSARNGQADMYAVAHLIGRERSLDFARDLVATRNLRKCQRQGRTSKPVEMFGELEDAAIVKPQSFPHGIAPLHRGIKRAYASLITVHELAVDVDDEVAVLGIELLEHNVPSLAA